MSIFNQLVSTLGAGDEITVTLQRTKQEVTLLLIPKVAGHDEASEDEVITALQAALSRPLYLTVPNGENVDEALAAGITQMQEARQPVLDKFEAYRQELTAASEAAEAAKKAADETRKKAAETRAATAKSKPAAKTTAKKTVAAPKAKPVAAKATKPAATKAAASTTAKKPANVLPATPPPNAPTDLFGAQII